MEKVVVLLLVEYNLIHLFLLHYGSKQFVHGGVAM